MQDPAFRSILNEADLVLPDGASVVLGSRILERPLQEKGGGDRLLPRPWCSAWLPGAGGCIFWAAGLGLQRKRRKI